MRVVAVLFGLSGVWAQYRLIGTQLEPPKKGEAQMELTLMPSYIRLKSQGQWDTLKAELDFVFTPEKTYWLDPKARIAYEVSVQKSSDSVFYFMEPLGEAEVAGQRVRQVRLSVAGRKLVVSWSDEIAFDWRPWVRPFGDSDFALFGRAFGTGAPLRVEVYDEAGRLLSLLRIEQVEEVPVDKPFSPPYPVRRLGE